MQDDNTLDTYTEIQSPRTHFSCAAIVEAAVENKLLRFVDIMTLVNGHLSKPQTVAARETV